jgi:hypothetical protein
MAGADSEKGYLETRRKKQRLEKSEAPFRYIVT